MAPATKVAVLVRFLNNLADLELPVLPVTGISTLLIRQTIRTARPAETGTKRLRLLHNGRILTATTNFARDVCRYVFSDEEDEAPKVYVHCLVGDELEPLALADEDRLDRLQIEQQQQQQQQLEGQQRTGFDRLRDAGFSALDIDELRAQFRAMYGDALEHESPEALRQLEDQWIDLTVRADGTDDFSRLLARVRRRGSAGSGPSSGSTNRDLLVGLMMGCMFGVFCFLFLKDRGLFRGQVRMSMVAGMVVNALFGLIRVWG